MVTEQEKIWVGAFGDDYVDRNQSAGQLSAKTALFARILSRASGVSSVLELGANVGLNIRAFKSLLPVAELAAVELNEKAFTELSKIPNVTSWHESIFTFKVPRTYDLSFTSGVLIHINPDKVPEVYAKLYESSSRYILVSEYYNPTPVEVLYRGHTGALYKRDWAGEMMDRYPDLHLVDYGFQYQRDAIFPMDDLTWFLMEKR